MGTDYVFRGRGRVRLVDPSQIHFLAKGSRLCSRGMIAITLHLASNRCKYRRLGFELLMRLINSLATEKGDPHCSTDTTCSQDEGRNRVSLNPSCRWT
jgi:hypothetical protein